MDCAKSEQLHCSHQACDARLRLSYVTAWLYPKQLFFELSNKTFIFVRDMDHSFGSSMQICHLWKTLPQRLHLEEHVMSVKINSGKRNPAAVLHCIQSPFTLGQSYKFNLKGGVRSNNNCGSVSHSAATVFSSPLGCTLPRKLADFNTPTIQLDVKVGAFYHWVKAETMSGTLSASSQKCRNHGDMVTKETAE